MGFFLFGGFLVWLALFVCFFNMVAVHYPNLRRECFCLTCCLFLREIGLIRCLKTFFYGCAPQLLQLAKGGNGAGMMSLPRRLLWPLGSAGMSECVEGVPKQGSVPCGGGVHPHLTDAERKTFSLIVIILM